MVVFVLSFYYKITVRYICVYIYLFRPFRNLISSNVQNGSTNVLLQFQIVFVTFLQLLYVRKCTNMNICINANAITSKWKLEFHFDFYVCLIKNSRTILSTILLPYCVSTAPRPFANVGSRKLYLSEMAVIAASIFSSGMAKAHV